MLKRGKSLLLSSIVGVAVLGFATPAQASGPAFTCASVTYQVLGAQLKIGAVDTSVSPAALTYTEVGSANAQSYNAAGYNMVDDYIYGINSLSHLLKVASDGTTEDLGVPSGFDSSQTFVAGDVTAAGHLIVIAYSDKSIWDIDIAGFTATSIGSMTSAPSSVDVGDIAIITSGGTTMAYGFDSTLGSLVSFDPTQNPVSINVDSSVAVGAGSPKGAVWADLSGNLTAFTNLTGDVYVVSGAGSGSPVASQVAQAPAATGNDGMKCASSESPFPPASDSGSGDSTLPDTGADIGSLYLGLAMAIGGFALVRIRRSAR